jgi:hypothetical protein
VLVEVPVVLFDEDPVLLVVFPFCGFMSTILLCDISTKAY